MLVSTVADFGARKGAILKESPALPAESAVDSRRIASFRAPNPPQFKGDTHKYAGWRTYFRAMCGIP